MNKARLFFNKARLFQNKAGLFQNKAGLFVKKALSDCFLLDFFAFCQKSKFAATLLPPKICLNTGITEDWWQDGSYTCPENINDIILGITFGVTNITFGVLIFLFGEIVRGSSLGKRPKGRAGVAQRSHFFHLYFVISVFILIFAA